MTDAAALLDQLELQLEELETGDAEVTTALEPLDASPITCRGRPTSMHRTRRPVQTAAARLSRSVKTCRNSWSMSPPASGSSVTCARSAPAAGATGSSRCRRRASPSPRGWPGRAGWRTCWSRNSPTIYPFYRQSEIYAREGLDLSRSTLTDWVGEAAGLLRSLVAGLKLHADDTPVPVLAPGQGKTKQGRLWTYVRDVTPPAVGVAYAPNR
jgi:transposase